MTEEQLEKDLQELQRIYHEQVNQLEEMKRRVAMAEGAIAYVQGALQQIKKENTSHEPDKQ